MKKWTAWKWFFVVAAFALGSFALFCQIDSYYADTHHKNWLFWVLGFASAFTALYLLIFKVIKQSNYGDNNQTN